MNKERMLQLAEHLETLPERRFDMRFIVNEGDDTKAKNIIRRLKALGEGECGTAGCIAGHTVSLFKLYDKPLREWNGAWREAEEYLELTTMEATWLFDYNYTNSSGVYWASTRKEAKDPRSAANAIRMLATLGLPNVFRGAEVIARYGE